MNTVPEASVDNDGILMPFISGTAVGFLGISLLWPATGSWSFLARSSAAVLLVVVAAVLFRVLLKPIKPWARFSFVVVLLIGCVVTYAVWKTVGFTWSIQQKGLWGTGIVTLGTIVMATLYCVVAQREWPYGLPSRRQSRSVADLSSVDNYRCSIGDHSWRSGVCSNCRAAHPPAPKCGGCGTNLGVSAVKDKKGNSGYLCANCKLQFRALLEPLSIRNFWMCRQCFYRVLAGTPVDAKVEENGGLCPSCSASVHITLVNLSQDKAIGRGIIGEAVE